MPRQEFNLCGNWLFNPGSSRDDEDPAVNDDSWHVMDVPNFWQSRRWWISQSISEKYSKAEDNRVKNRYTFDAANTKEGCYRHWVILPKSLQGKRIFVAFDGAATLAKVFWNGHLVGSHAGMFGRFECEVTPYAKPGEQNLLAVQLSVGSQESDDGSEVVGVAVTVPVTKSMLQWFPHGAFGAMGSSTPVAYGGLWQPVRLIITGSAKVDRVKFTPSLNSASIETVISGNAHNAVLRQSLVAKGSSKALWSSNHHINLTGKPLALMISTPKLHPKLWSPEHPNLYILKTAIISNGTAVDIRTDQVGFRTFQVKGDRFYLNGKPYWLRGANMPPYGMAPNDTALAHRFMRLMHQGNQMVTRSHCSPYNETWATAADEEGVAVSSEGIWPWALMGKIPSDALLHHWQKEQLEVINDLYNHPSIIINTIGNEMMQGCCQDIEKWKIISGVAKAVRKADPTRPIIISSEMTRAHYKDLWQNVLSTGGYDEGDIDDVHCYYGWYQPSVMMMDFNTPNGAARFTPTEGRAFISQEGGTGYPSVDDGFGTSLYTDRYAVPQAWVGHYASPKCGSPNIFQRSIADINKETAEKIRRQRRYWAGYMLFNNLCWYKNCYDSRTIEPYPVHNAVKFAYSPMLISLDSPQRHCYAGEEFMSRICIANDNTDIPVARSLTVLCWVVDSQGQKVGGVSKKHVQNCPYYSQVWDRISIQMPNVDGRKDVVFHMAVQSGSKRISENEYRMVLCSRKWANDGLGMGNAILINGDCTKDQFDNAKKAASGGATVIWLNAGKCAAEYMPDAIESVQSSSGEFVDMNNPQCALFDGLEPLDLRWWYSPGEVPSVTDTQFRLRSDSSVKSLTTYIRPHLYMSQADVDKLPHSTVFEQKCGNGRIIVSSMKTTASSADPIAARFISNLYKYAQCSATPPEGKDLN